MADAQPTPDSLMLGLFPSLESLIALEYMMYSVHSDHFSNVWGSELISITDCRAVCV